MFELFVNAAKFAVSDDVRKSTSAILDLIRRSPEWERDICTLEAKIVPPFSEQAALLSHLTVSKMTKLGYSSERIEAFKITYFELVSNAFEHGCHSTKDSIRIISDITAAYVSLTVLNPKGHKFDAKRIVEESSFLLEENPFSLTGRGLLVSYKSADSFQSINGNEGVKAVFFEDAVLFKIDVLDELTIIEIIDGLYNPSFERRLITTASNYLQNNLVLDFSKWIGNIHSSVGHRVVLKLNALYAKSGKRIVALLPPLESEVILPDSVVAYSWSEALARISKQNLLVKIKDLYEKNLKGLKRADRERYPTDVPN
jgi:anti-sigma regulatory factor (Ser/Thr protein kinase)